MVIPFKKGKRKVNNRGRKVPRGSSWEAVLLDIGDLIGFIVMVEHAYTQRRFYTVTGI